MQRREFLGLSVMGAAALAVGCDPCDCNDTLCDLPEWEFKCYVRRNQLILDPLYETVVVEDKVLNLAKTGYITSTWHGHIPTYSLFSLTRDEWLTEGVFKPLCMDLWGGDEWNRSYVEMRYLRGYGFSLESLEFEPVC